MFSCAPHSIPWSSSHSSLSLSSSFHPSTSPRLSSKSPVHSRQGDGGLLTSPPPTQVISPKTTSSQRRYVEFNQESMTEQRILEDVDYDDAAIGEMFFKAYRAQVYHSQREGLSVGRSSSSMSDRTEQPVVETMARSHDRTVQPVC